MKTYCQVLILFIAIAPCLFSSAHASAESPQTHQPKQTLPSRTKTTPLQRNEEISGILVDQTSSMPAKSFIDGFATGWRNYPFSENYTIVIKESINALRGSSVAVYHNQRIIFRSRLNRRSDNSNAGFEAAKAVKNRLRKQSSLNQVTGSADLADDEF